MDESNSERILKGPLDGEGPAEVKHVDYRKKRGSNIQERALQNQTLLQDPRSERQKLKPPEKTISRTAKTTIADGRNSTSNAL